VKYHSEDAKQLIYLKQLMKIGRRWSNYGHDRIYFNVIQLINLKRNNNTITLNGLDLSYPDAKNIENACMSGKLWYDITTKEFNSQNLHGTNYNLMKMAMEAIDKLTASSEFLLEDDLFEI